MTPSDANHVSENELERLVVETWQTVLGVTQISVDDNFFDLGADSFDMIRVANKLERCVRRKVPVESSLQAPTARHLAAFLETIGRPISTISLGPATKRSLSRRPLFCIYGLYLYKNLAATLGTELQIYGIYVPAETDLLRPRSSQKRWGLWNRLGAQALPTVEQLAQSYIREMRDVQPCGPYQLLGSSFGGVVAFEMARQLGAAGERVQLLAMLDSFAPGFSRPNSVRGWIHHLRRAVRRMRPQKSLTEASDRGEWEQLRELFRIEATRAYKPQPFASDAVLIRAEERFSLPGYQVDPLYGWEAWVKGRLVVQDVPGDHLGILSPPNVSVLADTLRAYLDRDEYIAPTA